MSGTQKLELTWVGKDERPRIEPRILLEDTALSYHAERRVAENDLFDNRLIEGDNLLGLKALEQEFTGAIKCICIDPPYNTGAAFAQYDDGIEHSLWLSLMRYRLETFKRLLAEDGSIWIFVDDNECHYLKVVCDEIFGRRNFVAAVIWRSTDNSNNDAKQFSVDHNTILVYSKQPDWQTNRLPRTEDQQAHYSNPDGDPRGPWFDGNPISSPNPRPNLCYSLVSPQGHEIPHPTNGWRWSRETMREKIESGEIRFTSDGRGIRRRTYLADQKDLPPSTLWADLEETGHNRQAKYEQKKLFPGLPKSALFSTPKPERVMQRIIHIASNPDDWVLDSFAGSGTSGAVAHKMRRRWIMIEQGEHCRTTIIPRLRKVIDGTDEGGVSHAVGWKGGGGFRYFRLAPTLLVRDGWGNLVINREYDPAMLAEAMCKHEGFTYAPSGDIYWQHGRSTERDFIYVTTQTLTRDQLAALSDEVGPERTLLVCCSAFRGRADDYANLTLKRMPNAVLGRCEWGRDDYSLRIASLPAAEPSEEAAPRASAARARRAEAPLFERGGES